MNRLNEPLLVLGATSLVGRFFVPLAAEAGRDVICVSRDAPPPGVAGRWQQADLTAPELELPPAAQAVCLCPIWLVPPALEALAAAGVRRIVAMSSTSRFTKTQSSHPAERAVAERLAQSEAALMAFCDAHGMLWTVLRPTLIYAEGHDGNVSRLASLIRRLGVLPISGAGQGRRQPVHAADLAAAALTALERPLARDRAYDLPGGETLSYRLMVERIFEGLGRRPRVIAVPPPAWRLALTLAGPLLPGATAAMGDRMAQDLVFDDTPARRDLGWAPRDFHPKF